MKVNIVVSLLVVNAAGWVSCKKTNYDALFNPPAQTPVASYNITGDSVIFNWISFNNTSIPPAPSLLGNEFKWDFGDGNAAIGYSPRHYYVYPGIYLTSLNYKLSNQSSTAYRSLSPGVGSGRFAGPHTFRRTWLYLLPGGGIANVALPDTLMTITSSQDTSLQIAGYNMAYRVSYQNGSTTMVYRPATLPAGQSAQFEYSFFEDSIRLRENIVTATTLSFKTYAAHK